MWLKKHSNVAFENDPHKQSSTIRGAPFQLGLFFPITISFDHGSSRLQSVIDK